MTDSSSTPDRSVNKRATRTVREYDARVRHRCRVLGSLAVIAAALLATAACGSGGSGSDSNPATPSPSIQPGTLIPNSTPRDEAAFLGPARLVPVNGVEIGYRQVGAGRPLLLIMGFSGTMGMWQYEFVQGLVDAGFQVTMFDNRGMGYSTDDDSQPLTMQLMAADTAALTRELRLDRPTVVGWSMGGEIALTMAVLHPEAAGAIVTSGGDAGSRHYVPPSERVLKILGDPTGDVSQLMGLLFPKSQSAASNAFVRSIMLYPQQQPSAEAIQRQLSAEDAFSKYSGTWDGLPSIGVPVLVQNGALDEVTRPINAQRVSARIPGAERVIFDDAAHGSLFQDIRQFVGLVRRTADSASR